MPRKKRITEKTPVEFNKYTSILAFDLSLNATGWCAALDLNNPDDWKYGVLPASKMTDIARLDFNLRKLEDFVKDWTDMDMADLVGEYPLVVMEDLSFGSNKAHSKENAALAYMFRHFLWKLGLDYLVVAPKQLKKFATGSGGNDVKKELIIKEVFKRFGRDVDDNNVADAIVLAYIGAAFTGKWEPTMQPQREVIHDLRTRLPLTLAKGLELVAAS